MGKSYSKLTPRIVNTFFILSLQQYFLTHHEHPWSPIDSKTTIDIVPEYETDDNMQKGMPQVVVENGPISIEPAGIGTGMYFQGPRMVSYNGVREEKRGVTDTKLQFTVSSYTQFRIITTSKDDADELAFEIAMFLMVLKYSVGSILQIQNVGSVQISPAQASGQTGWDNTYQASVQISYTFTVARMWQPTDWGILLTSIETELDNVNKGELPKPGDKDENGNDINIGETGGTGTGGQNGNWGGQGGISPNNPLGDGIDDGWEYLRFKISKDTILGYQPDQPDKGNDEQGESNPDDEQSESK